MGYQPCRTRSVSTVAALLLIVSATVAAQSFSVVHSFATGLGNPWAALTEGPGGKLYGTAETGGAFGRGAVYVLTPDGSGNFTASNLYSFSGADDGQSPHTRLLLASDGYLYGTTSEAGANFRGTAFRMDLSGALTTLHAFSAIDGAGASRLTEGDDQEFYGAASSGGQFDSGTVFRLDSAGNFTVLHDLSGTDGAYPGALAKGSDGAFYGLTTLGGALGNGTAFRVDALGSFSVIHDFTAADGAPPFGGLLLAADGYFYGGTQFGGANGLGTIFRVDAAGGLAVIHDFAIGEGQMPFGELLDPGDGYLYGANSVGPDAYTGTVFRVTASGSLTVLHAFLETDGGPPRGGLIRAVDGKIYGTSYGNPYSVGHGTVYRINPDGTGFETVYRFVNAEGTSPNSGFLLGADGNLYGSCGTGGSSDDGTVYRLDTLGELTVLHDFAGSDGSGPGVLVEASGGVLYGSTFAGGTGPTPFGVVFRIDALGAFSILHGFSTTDGAGPSGLGLAPDGSLYGTTYYGGPGPGTVFHIDALGVFETIHDFVYEEGAGPNGGLVWTGDGSFFGTTYGGGTSGIGTLFRVDAGGTFFSVRSFNGAEGSNPVSLRLGGDGNLYGVANGGSSGSGGLFRSSPDGLVRSLNSFGGAVGSLVLGLDGNFYGATPTGGAGTYGTVFRADPSGTVVILHSFTGTDGIEPLGGLVQAPDGDIYGTASLGGAFGGGVIFRLTPPAALSVWSLTPSSGPATGGTDVGVTGFGFQPGASVSFGGIPAARVLFGDPHLITATTPLLNPGTLNDLTVVNPDAVAGGYARGWFADFLDAPQSDLFHHSIESVFRAAITVGCGNGSYCGSAPVTRAQMAVFLLKAKLGGGYVPPPATGTRFLDVPADSFAADWIEDLAYRGITVGCGDGTHYCPDAAVSRAEMAVFLLKTLMGVGYPPPPATGLVFDDVPVDGFAADWIEDLHARGITGGCSTSPPLYCPDAPNSRGEMAVFLTLTFRLP